jgi:1-acyl-sn-glycerol-3-phosphate acyltransferase
LASKHQSELETVIFASILNDFSIIHKIELWNMPLIGTYMRRANFIAIDRRAGARALQEIVEKGSEAVGVKRPILIFPEGTRVPFGQRGKYHRGVVTLYKKLNVPILPVAHNAGQYFSLKTFIKRRGHIVFNFLPPIEPGKAEDDVLPLLEEAIESACAEISQPGGEGL